MNVQVASPVPGGSGHRHTPGSCRPPGIAEEEYVNDPEDDSLKEAIISSKFDAVADEYNHLLTTQLDSQRHYFEVTAARACCVPTS
jgi:BRCA1-associated protein